MTDFHRLSSRLQSYTHHPLVGRSAMRDHPVMGPIEVSPSLSIPRQTYSAADSHLSFLPSDFVCPDGQLPAVQQGSANEPRQ